MQLGNSDWLIFNNSGCSNNQAYTTEINLSFCTMDEFNCGDGDCIRLFHKKTLSFQFSLQTSGQMLKNIYRTNIPHEIDEENPLCKYFFSMLLVCVHERVRVICCLVKGGFNHN